MSSNDCFKGLESGWYLTARAIGTHSSQPCALYIHNGKCPGFVDGATSFMSCMDDHVGFLNYAQVDRCELRVFPEGSLARAIAEGVGWGSWVFESPPNWPLTPLRLNRPHAWEGSLEFE